MKRRTSGLLLSLLMLMSLTACGGEGGDEVVVFAAASLEEALTEIGARYIAQRDHVSIVFNFDSYSTVITNLRFFSGINRLSQEPDGN